MTPPETDRALRAARQTLHTDRLLGVDFVPLRESRRVVARAEQAQASGPDTQVEPKTVGRAPTIAEAPSAAAHSPSAECAERREAKRRALETLRARHDAECPHCTAATYHTQTVFGDGNPDARLMFVGEAPGAEEDRQGIPFVGRAGQKLNEMIRAMGLAREDVYIANVLKSRPPENATPTAEEAARCGPYLDAQIAIIRPQVIVALGKPAMNYLLDTREGINAMRGRWFEYRPRLMDSDLAPIPVMPTFHPAYLLRSYTLENRQKVWSDLQQVMARLKSLPCA